MAFRTIARMNGARSLRIQVFRKRKTPSFDMMSMNIFQLYSRYVHFAMCYVYC